MYVQLFNASMFSRVDRMIDFQTMCHGVFFAEWKTPLRGGNPRSGRNHVYFSHSIHSSVYWVRLIRLHSVAKNVPWDTEAISRNFLDQSIFWCGLWPWCIIVISSYDSCHVRHLTACNIPSWLGKNCWRYCSVAKCTHKKRADSVFGLSVFIQISALRRRRFGRFDVQRLSVLWHSLISLVKRVLK